ncbi:hypothetical protein BCR35DRAFT_298376 [Leucosporidium creatinivorum]|uniref:Uncharacterized protein n=1 Tax=Leucosporidium creatinivorum TaxID=106004 RepID=A0A1Y2G4I1_9BASI|nr:hypothetical protein BCR35DRAFT_298376 [Leucosporidium creatinivorum]
MLTKTTSRGSFLSLASTMNEKESIKTTRSKSSLLRRLFSTETDPSKPKLSALEELEQLRRRSGHPSVQAYHAPTGNFSSI